LISQRLQINLFGKKKTLVFEGEQHQEIIVVCFLRIDI